MAALEKPAEVSREYRHHRKGLWLWSSVKELLYLVMARADLSLSILGTLGR